ncbi:MAG: 3-hydroxyacyl-ACP dehydratase FabZ [Kiritimatiellia bacterium]
MNNRKVTDLLPHRPPFLFVDRVVSIGESEAVAERTVREDEAYLKGHFPGNPMVPGVLIVESMAQTAGLALAGGENEDDTPERAVFYLSKISRARFRRAVFPEETMRITAGVTRSFGGSAVIEAKVEVAGEIAAEGELVLSRK